MQMQPQQMQQQSSSYRQLNQTQFRVGPSAGGSGGASATTPTMGSGALGWQQQQPSVSDATPASRYQMNPAQSIAPSRGDRSAQYSAAAHRGTSSYYGQTQVPPQPQYSQGRTPTATGQQYTAPVTPSQYGGYSTGSAMYQRQAASGAPQTPVTSSSAQQAAYNMRSTMPSYSSGGQPPNSYQNFQTTPSYGRYPSGVHSGYGASEPTQAAAAAAAMPQGQGVFPHQQYMGSSQRSQFSGQTGQSRGRGRGDRSNYNKNFGGRRGGRGRGNRGNDRGGRGRGRPGGRGRGGPPPSMETTPLTPSASTVPVGQQAAGGQTQPTTNGDPTATEDPNVAAEEPITMRTQIEPPGRVMLQWEQPMYSEPERFFRVLSFDVLGDKVWRSARAYQRPRPGRPDFWSWGYRKDFLFKEITQFSPDIICLQEVDQYEYFEQNLAPLGYVGIYEQRKPTEQARLYVVHGLAIFWQSTKFEYLGRKSVPLGNPYYVNEMALCVRLRRNDPNTTTPLNSSRNVVIDVWNTHLMEGRNNQVEKRRKKQAQELVDHIARVSHEDLGDKTLGRPRSAAERSRPLMEPKADAKPLDVVAPSDELTNDRARELTDIESNKEDQPETKELELSMATEMDPESKEPEPGNKLQELFRSRMNIAINSEPSSESQDASLGLPDTRRYPAGSYDDYKRGLPQPRDLLKYPVILCGNFSSAPYPDDVGKDESEAVQPITYSYLTYNATHSKDNNWLRKALDNLRATQSQPRRQWVLHSAYATTFGEPTFTVWPDKKNNQKPYPVDYIFYTQNRTSGLAVLTVLEPLSEKWVQAGAAKSLPCHSFPSDHIPLVADFEFRGGQPAPQ